MISLSNLHKLGFSSSLSNSSWTLKTVSGDTLAVLGEVVLPLLVQGRNLSHSFVVVSQGLFPGDVLVGSSFLVEHLIDVCLPDSLLKGNGFTIPLIDITKDSALCAAFASFSSSSPHKYPNSPPTWTPDDGSPYAVAVKYTSLPAFCACLVDVKVSEPGKTALVLPDGVRVQGLVVEPALYSVVGGLTSLRLINATGNLIALQSGFYN